MSTDTPGVSGLRDTWHALSVIGTRSSRAAWQTPGVYLVTALGLLAGAVLLHTALDFVGRSAVLAAAQPLFLPASAVITLLSIYLALNAAVSAARERDLGTLEVLYYGPVGPAAFILGKFSAQMRVYAAMLVLVLVWTNLLTLVFNLAFSPALIVLLLTSLAAGAVVIAFGLLLAAAGGRARGALVAFILVILLLVAVQAADIIVTDLIPTPESATRSDPLLVVRAALAAVTSALNWISPYAGLQSAMNALTAGALDRYALHLGVMLAQTALLLWGAVAILRRKGTRGA